MRPCRLFFLALFLVFLPHSCVMERVTTNHFYKYAKSRQNDLRLSVYMTAQDVTNYLTDDRKRLLAVKSMRNLGITKAYVEVYRGGLIVDTSLLTNAINYLKRYGFDVAGGIATVPGKDFGIRQEGPLGWFNWQNAKTQKDLKRVIGQTAGLFDEFILDDFFCTADTSLESRQARGNKSWSEYRRDLLVRLANEIFIGPAKRINPNITMIIKYPQWYDRFHLFGYDPERESAMFDKIWVGTETRGQYTQRYGFVQPYEGFINYRWLKSIAGKKTGGAWFDHGDCNGIDFIDQAYQSVLAGAGEIIIFHFGDVVRGHPGHNLLRRRFFELADLAREIKTHPVSGVIGYKPPNSDAGGDLYIMDFIGMLGVPLVPDAKYPENARVIFLPTQASADANIQTKVNASLKSGTTLVFTAGFLARAGRELAQMAGIAWPVKVMPMRADSVYVNGALDTVKYGLDLEAPLKLAGASALLTAKAGMKKVPFLTKMERGGSSIYVLNTHTFSQADFDAVGEVLLCPRPLGLLEIPVEWANALRGVFNLPLGLELLAPTRIVLQPLKGDGWVIHNYSQQPERVVFGLKGAGLAQLIDGFTGKPIKTNHGRISLTMPARSRIWLTKAKKKR